MARPTITANTGTGSDTAASGCGHTAITAGGNDGASVNGTTTVDLTADNPDLSAVAADASSGTWCMWVNTSTGRQFSRITAADNTAKTVTVATAYAVTESGKAWGIGGKRATWTVAMFADAQAGWTLQTETDQNISAALVTGAAGDTTSGPILVKGDSASTLRVITQSANANCFTVSNTQWAFANLQLKCSAGTKTSNAGISIGTAVVRVVNCIFGGSANPVYNGILHTENGGSALCVGCEFYTAYNGWSTGTRASITVAAVDCFFHDCGNSGIVSTDSGTAVLIRCVFHGNAEDGAALPSSTNVVDSCVFDANTDDGLVVGPTNLLVLTNNIFSNHSGTSDQGTKCGAAVPFMTQMYVDFNCLYNNATPDANLPTQTNGSTADPQYTDAANHDFGVGANMKAIGGPPAAANHLGISSTTHSYLDIGAAQRSETVDEASRNTDPGEANVKSGTSYKIQNVAKNGSYAGGSGGTRAWASAG